MFSWEVLQRMSSEMRYNPCLNETVSLPASVAKETIATSKNNQFQFSLKHIPTWLADILKMNFEELPTIAKEKFDIELMLAELKDGHDLMVKKIVDTLIEDSSIDQINEFTSWSNQFLAQLIHGVAARHLTAIDELTECIAEDERQKANCNDLLTVKSSMRNIFINKTLALVLAKESANTYPISKEGVSLLKEFSKLVTRLENVTKKINVFSKNKLRPLNVSL